MEINNVFTDKFYGKIKVACKGCISLNILINLLVLRKSVSHFSVKIIMQECSTHVSHLFTHWLLVQHNRKWCSDAMLKCYNMLVSSCVGRKYIYYSYYKHQPSNMKTLHYAALLGRVLRIISKLLILPPLSDLSTLIMQQTLWNLDQSHTAEIQGVS